MLRTRRRSCSKAQVKRVAARQQAPALQRRVDDQDQRHDERERPGRSRPAPAARTRRAAGAWPGPGRLASAARPALAGRGGRAGRGLSPGPRVTRPHVSVIGMKMLSHSSRSSSVVRLRPNGVRASSASSGHRNSLWAVASRSAAYPPLSSVACCGDQVLHRRHRRHVEHPLGDHLRDLGLVDEVHQLVGALRVRRVRGDQHVVDPQQRAALGHARTRTGRPPRSCSRGRRRTRPSWPTGCPR